ncbi:MAG: signal peptide peptidase SppA [Bacteroidales bacterium]|nr:signal peptide peptidase SppA [Bacteroidales bacterium]
MKSFLKTVFAVMVGMFIMGVAGMVFFFIFFVGSLASMSSDNSVSKPTAPGDVLVLKINGPVNELPPTMPFAFDVVSGLTMNSDASLRGYLNAIQIAKNDPNIVGIYLNTDGMSASPATYEALHDALVDFRSTDKWLIAYNDNYSLGQYYVASSASELYVNTIGSVTFDGMCSVLTYPKGLLDKLNIEMQIFRVGQFKSAVEPYMVEHISEANRLQTETYLRNIWNRMAEDIAATRRIPVATLEDLANQAVSYMNPEELAKTGLVDGQLYKTDVEKIILERTHSDKLQGIQAKELVNGNYDTYFPQHYTDKVAVLYAVGEIASEGTMQNGEDGIYYEDLIKEIRKIADDDDIKAVVLRVNSPGGSGFASEQIWKALTDLKDKKPLVVSMGDYAASGGYYISCMADYVVAEPNTLTGSIGVFGVIPNFGGLTTGKLGINFEEVKTHEFGRLNNTRRVTPAERQKMQASVEEFYTLFTKRCAEGRHLPVDSIQNVGGGRVWTGSDAVRLGLVDELGGLSVALAKAQELAQLSDNYTLVNYPEAKSQIEQLLEMMGEEQQDLTLRIADRLLGSSAADRSAVRFLEHLQQADRIQARSFEAVEY